MLCWRGVVEPNLERSVLGRMRGTAIVSSLLLCAGSARAEHSGRTEWSSKVSMVETTSAQSPASELSPAEPSVVTPTATPVIIPIAKERQPPPQLFGPRNVHLGVRFSFHFEESDEEVELIGAGVDGNLTLFVHQGVGFDAGLGVTTGRYAALRLTPGVRYVYDGLPVLKPHFGLFYRHSAALKHDGTSDALGGRLGANVMLYRNLYWSGAVVYRHLLGDVHSGDRGLWYSEILLGLVL